jgi:hypothetical protein
MKQYLTRKEVAKILKVDPLTIRRWEREGRVTPCAYIKNRPRYNPFSFESFDGIPASIFQGKDLVSSEAKTIAELSRQCGCSNEIFLKELDKLYWYDKEMVKLYIECGSYRAIQERIASRTKDGKGIPYTTCYKTIKKAINQIKQSIYLQHQHSKPIHEMVIELANTISEGMKKHFKKYEA